MSAAGRGSRVAGAVLCAAACWGPLAQGVAAQTMRTFTASRRLESAPTLAVRVEFGSGTLQLGPAQRGMLYDLSLRYDQDRAAPLHRYDAEHHLLDVRLRPVGEGGVRVTSREQLAQHAALALAPSIPVTLDVTLGATQGTLDLGGLRVTRAAVHAVASRTLVRVTRPNAVACEALDLDGGASELVTEQLGNLRCAEIRFEGGMARALLDLTGDWSGALRVQARQALGTLALTLPKDAGVRLVLDRTLASWTPSGFQRDGQAWVTPNWRSAARTIQVDVTAAVGGLEVSWQ